MNGFSQVTDFTDSGKLKVENRTYEHETMQDYSNPPKQRTCGTVLPSYDEIRTRQEDVFVDASSSYDDVITEEEKSRDGTGRVLETEITEEGVGQEMGPQNGLKGDSIHCYLCGGLYERPKILPCLHSFCLRCLQEFERRQTELKPARKKINGGHDDDEEQDDTLADGSGLTDELSCPRCRRIFQISGGEAGGLQTLPDHIFYSRLVSVHRQASQPGGSLSPKGSASPERDGGPGGSDPLELELCSVCGAEGVEDEPGTKPEIARFACLDCAEKLCADCARAHKKQTLSRGHNILPLTDPLFTNPTGSVAPGLGLDSGVGRDQMVEQLSVCGQHPNEKVSLYCSDCSIPICAKCRSTTHSVHATSDVRGVASRGRLSLEEGLDRIYGRLEAVNQLRESMSKQQETFLQQVAEANAEIRATADEMRREIDGYEEQLIRETLAIRDNTVQELAKVHDEVDDDYATLTSLRDLSEHLLSEGTDADIALLSGRVLARRRHLESTNHDVSVCSVKFRPSPPSKVNPLGKVAILDIDSSDPYIDSPSVIQVIPGTESVAGVTLLDGELYIVRDLTPFLDVYNAISFAPIRRLRLDGLRKPADVTSSSTNQSLYVSDSTGHVYCLQPHGQILIRWQCDGEPSGLYVYPPNGNVLVTCYDSRLLKEFTHDGTHIRTVRLQQDMANPSHTIIAEPDRFIICHGWESGKLHRVCYIDSLGRTMRTYGGSNGSGSGRMDSPARLAVDPFGYVFVLDRNNDRVQLLSPNLVHVRDLISRGHFGARQPRRMCLDAANGCLYVGMIDGRIIAFRILDV